MGLLSTNFAANKVGIVRISDTMLGLRSRIKDAQHSLGYGV